VLVLLSLRSASRSRPWPTRAGRGGACRGAAERHGAVGAGPDVAARGAAGRRGWARRSWPCSACMPCSSAWARRAVGNSRTTPIAGADTGRALAGGVGQGGAAGGSLASMAAVILVLWGCAPGPPEAVCANPALQEHRHSIGVISDGRHQSAAAEAAGSGGAGLVAAQLGAVTPAFAQTKAPSRATASSGSFGARSSGSTPGVLGVGLCRGRPRRRPAGAAVARLGPMTSMRRDGPDPRGCRLTVCSFPICAAMARPASSRRTRRATPSLRRSPPTPSPFRCVADPEGTCRRVRWGRKNANLMVFLWPEPASPGLREAACQSGGLQPALRDLAC